MYAQSCNLATVPEKEGVVLLVDLEGRNGVRAFLGCVILDLFAGSRDGRCRTRLCVDLEVVEAE